MTRTMFFAASTVALSFAPAAIAKPVQVTRFAAPIAVTPGPAAPVTKAGTLEQSTYEGAVALELARLGFASDGEVRYTYSVEVTKDVRTDRARRSPVTIGIGGGTGGWGGGVGLGASFGIGRGRGRDMTVTRLSVQLRDRASGNTVWEGRAETESTAVGGERIERLAAALFKDFPGQTGRTISVK